jgi:hypothetical protein
MTTYFTGPAFPFSFEVDGDQRWAYGVSLRDYAAIEMAKMLMQTHNEDFDVAAAKAYEMADALARASAPKQDVADH